MNLPTGRGPTSGSPAGETQDNNNHKKNNSQDSNGPQSDQHTQAAMIDAINQVFALFRRNYHNQYYKVL